MECYLLCSLKWNSISTIKIYKQTLILLLRIIYYNRSVRLIITDSNIICGRYFRWFLFLNFRSSSDRNYLQQSIVPTDHFQKSLPHLAIPKLEETCQRYISAQKPILTDAELANTEKIVEQFKSSIGKGITLYIHASTRKLLFVLLLF